MQEQQYELLLHLLLFWVSIDYRSFPWSVILRHESQNSYVNSCLSSTRRQRCHDAVCAGLGAYESSSEESGNDDDDQEDITDQQLQVRFP